MHKFPFLTRFLVAAFIALLLVGCSKKATPQPTRNYVVRFGVVLIPNSALPEYGMGFSEKAGWTMESWDKRQQLAASLFKDPEKFPSYLQDPGWLTVVKTGETVRIALQKGDQYESSALRKHGVELQQFEGTMSVHNEEGDFINCTWSCDYNVTVNGANWGGLYPGGAAIRPGKPDLTPVHNYNGQGLWMLVYLQPYPNRK